MKRFAWCALAASFVFGMAPSAVAQPAATPATIVVGGYSQPAIFVLPVVILIVAGWLAYALTRPAPPPGDPRR
jgi:hypothetical protein